MENQPQNSDNKSLKTRFRILRINGEKKAFSLEPIFWTILEHQAAEKGLKIGDHIASILSNLQQPKNMSSELRRTAAESLWNKAEIENKNEMADITNRILKVTPAPAFLIDSKRNITAYNAAFRRTIGLDFDANAPKLAEIRLGASIPRIVEVLQTTDGKALSLPFVLNKSDHKLIGNLNATIYRIERGLAQLFCVIKNIKNTE